MRHTHALLIGVSTYCDYTYCIALRIGITVFNNSYIYHSPPNTLPVVVTIRNTVRYTPTVSTVAVVYPRVSPKQYLIMNHKYLSY